MTWTSSGIRTLRQEMGLSQEQLARLLGISMNTVARWEQGDRTPDRYNELQLNKLRNRKGEKAT